VFAFNSNGFSTSGVNGFINYSGLLEVAWTFREQPKFFDVVTYTGNGSTSGQTISHNLGSKPGTIIIKRTDSTSDWIVQSRVNDTTYSYGLKLNSTAAQQGTYTPVDAQLNSTQFSNFIADDPLATNASGGTYVAYLFAHNAGGFGLSGNDNVISCGSFTTDGSGNATVDLGYEPQWLVNKATNNPQNWIITDNMRGMFASAQPQCLFANTSGAEVTATNLRITSTGFTITGYAANQTSIYIAIRRGPMKVPTTGTSVYNGIARSGTGSAATVTGAGFPPDLVIGKGRNSGAQTSAAFTDKLRGIRAELYSAATAAEVASGTSLGAVNAFTMDGFNLDADTNGGYYNWSAGTYINWCLRRAPGFFDEVCYSGLNAVRDVSHNLSVAPELMIVKRRNAASSWFVYSASLGAENYMLLDSTAAVASSSVFWNNTTPTSSVFTLGNNSGVNSLNNNYVAYLFASCPSVSSVGSYTGNGSSQTINCGFTGGARFVMIKRTDSTGDWYVWDTARGIVSGNDPHLSLNTTTAEVTSNDTIDTDSTGFVVNQVSATNVNVSSATYIFMAVA